MDANTTDFNYHGGTPSDATFGTFTVSSASTGSFAPYIGDAGLVRSFSRSTVPLVVHKATGQNIDQLLDENIFQKIGIARDEWSWEDRDGMPIPYSGLHITARGLARSFALEMVSALSLIRSACSFFFDFVTPTGSKSKSKVYCMFMSELTELLMGNCMSVPNKVLAPNLSVPRRTRRGEYQLIAECGNLTAIIDVGGRIAASTVSSNRNFILRRVQNDNRPRFNLGDCVQTYKDDKESVNSYTFHVATVPNETSVSVYSSEESTAQLQIQGTTVLLSVDGVTWHEIMPPSATLRLSKRGWPAPLPLQE